MQNSPTDCKCPGCGIDLKKALPDNLVKRLWAALGGRHTKGRSRITADQQRRMQESRRRNREGRR